MPDSPSNPSWNAIRRAFESLLELEPAARASVLLELRADEPELAKEVAELLEHAAEADAAFESGIQGLPAEVLEAAEEEEGRDPLPEGAAVGPYRIVEEIGRGGAGTVFRARRVDGAYEQEVAVKVLRRGLDTEDVLARFRAERQILASLSHPNIARLMDGGATGDGRPYLVMELVEGEPITVHADARRLPIEERLRLFIEVSHAVQYAHRNMVIHRDIKPGNILVDRNGRVKLLDFGIAKLVDDSAIESAETPLTRTGYRLMTPDWASPEQVKGELVTTASDVFQLGVLLFELLAGERPGRHTGQTPADTVRSITEDRAEAPSAVIARRMRTSGSRAIEIAARRGTEPNRLRGRLRGDLDTIVRMALRKEPHRRYLSPGDLADDLERHLAKHPVRARPDRWAYRTRKLIARHPARLAVAATLTLTGMGFIATQHAHSLRLEEERNVAIAATEYAEAARIEAEGALDQAEQVAAFLVGMFDAANPERTAGESLTARSLLARGADQIDQAVTDPEVDARIRTSIMAAYRGLGLFEEGLALAEPALRRFATGEMGETEFAKVRYQRADLLEQLGAYTEAEEEHREVLTIRRRVLGDQHVDIAESLNAVAGTLMIQGRPEDAEPFYREALDMRRSLLGERHHQVANSLQSLGFMLRRQGRLNDARGILTEALALQRDLLSPSDPAVAATLDNLGGTLRDLGSFAEAEALYRQALEIRRHGFGDRHPRTAVTLANYGLLQQRQGDLDHAAALLGEALSIRRETLPAKHRGIAGIARAFALVQAERGESELAIELLEEAAAIQRQALGQDHPATAQTHHDLGVLLLNVGRGPAAIPHLREAAALRQSHFGPGHRMTEESESKLDIALSSRDHGR